jgi:hypothetical protein
MKVNTDKSFAGVFYVTARFILARAHCDLGYFSFCYLFYLTPRRKVEMHINLGKRTESHRKKVTGQKCHRTKSHKTPRTKSHRKKSHNLYCLPWRTKSHRTKSHNLYFLPWRTKNHRTKSHKYSLFKTSSLLQDEEL